MLSVTPKFMKTLALLCAAIVLFGCSSGKEIVQDSNQRSSQRDLAQLEALYWQRLADSRSHFVQADVDFMSKMIVHHAQALVMATLAETHTNDRSIRLLATRIINAQNDEIATMQRWLRDRNQPVPLISFEGVDLQVEIEPPRRIAGQRTTHTQHASGAAHDHTDMPGMLTEEQLQRLFVSREETFNHLFLSFMILHHEGAVDMVYEWFAADGAGNDEETYRLASDIYADQKTEIETMRKMLERMDSFQTSP